MQDAAHDGANPPGDASKIPSYWDYLRVEELLSLQGGVRGDESELSDHEVLFVIVHQIYELWFKLVLRELDTARALIKRDPVPDQDLSRFVASLRRTTTILEQAADHFKVMETLTTRDFLDFRDELLPASGFQSAQMRELEILLGLVESERLHLGWEGSYLDMLKRHDGGASPAHDRVMRRLAETPSLRGAVLGWLHRTPIRGSTPADDGDAETVASFVSDYIASMKSELARTESLAARAARSDEAREKIAARYAAELRAAAAFLRAESVPPEARAATSRIRAAAVFIESYRELPLLAWPRAALDAIIALEQAFVIFRQRHARMVEREIGRRVGTGGSAGVDYLDSTALKYRVFRDLWAVRTLLVRREAVPPLEESEFYDFRFDGSRS